MTGLLLIAMASLTQAQGYPQTQPYGTTHADMATPYEAPQRDAQGNRIVINGRVIDSEDQGTPGRPVTLSNRPASTLAAGGTLGRPSVTAAAIGNSVSITGVSNSTIIIEQRNQASQTVNIGTSQTSDGGEND